MFRFRFNAAPSARVAPPPLSAPPPPPAAPRRHSSLASPLAADASRITTSTSTSAFASTTPTTTTTTTTAIRSSGNESPMAPTTRRTTAAAKQGQAQGQGRRQGKGKGKGKATPNGTLLDTFKSAKPAGVVKSKTAAKTTGRKPKAAEEAATSAVGNGPADALRIDAALSLPSAPLDAPSPSSTCGILLQRAEAHLVSVSPALAPLIAANPCPLFAPAGLAEAVDPFTSLASGIISQQVSGAAARSIKAKFVALFESELAAGSLRFPTAEMVLARTPATLQSAGVSTRKADYLHSLARAFASGELAPSFLATASDDELIAALTKIHGIGRWSAEMFLMFGLKRIDVFSVGDLGIQRGMAAWQGRNVKALKKASDGARPKKWKYMAEKEMLQLAEPFKPYRTLFCWYMWRCEGTDIDAMGNTAVSAKVKV